MCHVAVISDERSVVAGKREQRDFGAVQRFGVWFDRAQSRRATRLEGDDVWQRARRVDGLRIVVRNRRVFAAAILAADGSYRRRRRYLIFLVVPLRFWIVFVFAVERAQVRRVTRPKLV